MSSQHELKRWLENSTDDIIDGQGPVHRYELYHQVDGGAGEKLGQFAPASSPSDVDDIVAAIWDAAEIDAKTRSGRPERYAVVEYRIDPDSEEPLGDYTNQIAFVLRDRAAPPSMFGDTESPSGQGLQAQQMRHNERLMQQLTALTEGSVGRLMSENRDLSKRLETMQSKFFEVAELHQKLLDRSSERAIEQAEAQASAQRKDAMFDFLMQMAPLILAKFAMGKSGVGSMASGLRDNSVGKLLQNLSEEEAMSVFQALKPNNRAFLLELYSSYKQDHEEREAGKPEVLKRQDSGEDSVN